MSKQELQDAAGRLARRLFKRQLRIAAAESLTGGLFAAALVSVPGISEVFLGAIVAYQNSVKENLLGVPAAVLDGEGPVSFTCAGAMLDGVQRHFAPDIAVSFTGNAGPTADRHSEVGEVYVGLDVPDGRYLMRLQLEGDREAIREAATLQALRCLTALLDGDTTCTSPPFDGHVAEIRRE